ncbi:MAG: sulfotransferase [Chloroflexota bacterium]
MLKPNFLFIGADKTGSTWLYQLLRQHPNVYVPNIKDVYFFDRYYDKGLDWYSALFSGAPVDALAIGELSHDYLYSSQAAARIAKDLPNVKLIVTLRNPIQRSFSHYLYLRRGGKTQGSFHQAAKALPEIIDHSIYAPNLAKYFQLFDASQIKVVTFDKLKSDPEGYAKEILSFLDVDFMPDYPYHEDVLVAAKPRSFIVSRVVKAVANIARRLGLPQLVGAVKYSKLRNLVFSPYEKGSLPQMDDSLKEELIEIFEDDVSVLEKMLHIDLSHWLKIL